MATSRKPKVSQLLPLSQRGWGRRKNWRSSDVISNDFLGKILGKSYGKNSIEFLEIEVSMGRSFIDGKS